MTDSAYQYTVTEYYNGTHIINTTRSSRQPIQVTGLIIEDSRLVIDSRLTSFCSTGATQGMRTYQLTSLNSTSPWRLSPIKNFVIGVGLNAQATTLITVVTPTHTDVYDPTCLSRTFNMPSVAVDGECSGYGCCNASLIPPSRNLRLTEFSTKVNTDENSQWKKYPCRYAMLAAAGSYVFAAKDMEGEGLLNNFSGGIPTIVDYDMGEQSCPAPGQQPGPDYACSSNSKCLNSSTGRGYFCYCATYYAGNAYLTDGCKGTPYV
ncbi:hypothetical protein ACQ4PT_047283 [Festuca glaucescens]